MLSPVNQAKMAKDDLDLGSAGVVLLPDQPGPYPHLAVTSAKNGHIYLLNRDDLGGYSVAGKRNPQLVQEISGVLRQQMGTPAPGMRASRCPANLGGAARIAGTHQPKWWTERQSGGGSSAYLKSEA